MSTFVQITARRNDLRALARLVERGEFADAFNVLSELFTNADDIDAQTLGFVLETAADRVPDEEHF